MSCEPRQLKPASKPADISRGLEALERMPGMAFTSNAMGECDYVSHQWLEFTGARVEQVLGMGWLSWLHPDDQERVSESWRDAAGTRAIYDEEYRIRRRDGVYEWFQVRASSQRDTAGNVIRWYGAAVSIQDIKTREQQLFDSEERYRTSFDNAAIGLTHVAPDGRWILVNDHFCRTIGYSREEMLNLHVQDVTYPADRPDDDAQRERLFRGEISSYSIEKRYIRKDSSLIWVNVTRSLVRDAGGIPKYAITIVQDTSERMAAEEALGESMGRLRAVVETAVDGIITINESGTVESINPAGERIFGYAAAEVIGQNVKMLMPDPYHSEHDTYLGNFQRTSVARIIGSGREVEGRRKDGSTFAMDLAVSETRLKERRIYTGLVRDITERKRFEAELLRHREHLEDLVRHRTAELEASHQRLRVSERMAAIGTLSAGLGHDMGNLLLPVRVRLDAMQAQALTPQLQEDVRAIHQASDYLAQLARGLKLLAADPEAASGEGETTKLGEWWRDVRGLLKNLLPRETVLEAELAETLPPVIITRAALTQAVFNLVQNAADALRGRPHPRVTIRAREDGAWVRLAVADNGVGMSSETAARCLEPFFTTKTRAISTGLGLSLVQGTVQRVGGRVELKSKLGEGTAFELVLPAMRPGADAGPEHGRRAVVDIREPRVSQFVSSLLRAAGYSVESGDATAGKDVRIWAVEPEGARLTRARDFVERDARRRVIVFGALPEGEAPHPQFIVLEGKFVPTLIRDAVREVARAGGE